MSNQFRKLFPYLALFVGLAGVAWAVSFTTLPPADFSFNNGDECKTVDPAKANGMPEHRLLNAIFEGLLQNVPDEEAIAAGKTVSLVQKPGVAFEPEVSADGRVYTFKIRPDARWSDGQSITAEDFVWSWRRTLHPETAAIYAYQLSYIAGAEKYNSGEVQPGDEVEVELADRPNAEQPFPRGTVFRGKLERIDKPVEPQFTADTSPREKKEKQSDWRKRWVYVVEVASEEKQSAIADQLEIKKIDRERRAFCRHKEVKTAEGFDSVSQCQTVLLDFDSQVGVKATDSQTLVVTLKARTPFFRELVAFYPLFPVNRRCVERYGTPNWTRAENIVSNGPFVMASRRIRDRVRMTKNPHYWDAANVKLNIVDAFPIQSDTTGLNMYLRGQLDWQHPPPITIMPEIRKRSDLHTAPMFTTYFYRCNVTKPPLDNVLVRQALHRAIDRQKICEQVTQGGQLPRLSLVPPGMRGYESPSGLEFDKVEAQRLLAEAGFPKGQGFPKIELLFNSNEAHRAIAEVIQHDWQETLGISVELQMLAWPVYLENMHKMNYQICRAGWVADYSDPNTFLDMFVTGGQNNETGWSNTDYDRLIQQAAEEPDSAKRMKLFQEAETILMRELPILPIYSYVSQNLVRPYVKGFHANVQDYYPIHKLWIDPDEKRSVLRSEGL